MLGKPEAQREGWFRDEAVLVLVQHVHLPATSRQSGSTHRHHLLNDFIAGNGVGVSEMGATTLAGGLGGHGSGQKRGA